MPSGDQSAWFTPSHGVRTENRSFQVSAIVEVHALQALGHHDGGRSIRCEVQVVRRRHMDRATLVAGRRVDLDEAVRAACRGVQRCQIPRCDDVLHESADLVVLDDLHGLLVDHGDRSVVVAGHVHVGLGVGDSRAHLADASVRVDARHSRGGGCRRCRSRRWIGNCLRRVGDRSGCGQVQLDPRRGRRVGGRRGCRPRCRRASRGTDEQREAQHGGHGGGPTAAIALPRSCHCVDARRLDRSVRPFKVSPW